MALIQRINEMLKQKKGGVFIFLIMSIVVFAPLGALVLDFGNIYLKSKKVKNALNRAVKASVVAVQEGEPLAQGKFLINEEKGEENFYLVLAGNLGLDPDTLEPLPNSLVEEAPNILEFSIHNDDLPKNYYVPAMDTTYEIINPSVIAAVEFKVRGIFLNQTLLIARLSASQLISIYD